MATYLITFDALAPDGATGAQAVADRPGTRLDLVLGNPTTLLAETGPGGGLVVSSGSPWGEAGAAVSLGARIRATCRAGDGVPQIFDTLELDGRAVGMIGQDAPVIAAPGGPRAMVFEVTSVEVASDHLLLALPAMAAMDMTTDRGAALAGRPRKSPLAFAFGTRIDTPDGPRPVEALAAGDLVSTLDNGSQPLRWTGQRHVLPTEMALREDLRPLRLESGVLGNGRTLVVSPRHRILLNDWRAQVYFGEDQVLVPAQALINGVTVRQVLPIAGVTYVHLLFDRHEVIVAEGMLSESFHPAQTGLASLDAAQRQEIEALFPGQVLERRRAAFPMLRMAEARALRLPG